MRQILGKKFIWQSLHFVGLLQMIVQIGRTSPIIIMQTGMMPADTIGYRQLKAFLPKQLPGKHRSCCGMVHLARIMQRQVVSRCRLDMLLEL